ncbi:hypothetical protein Tco_1123258 [Tanacetum coccineum]|uniref:Reverse transcriptase domain-containing protein n=1 Tax=Tanacetum coccineum TaxID=301880 RepID=A0ABQ5J5S5_9ASTR
MLKSLLSNKEKLIELANTPVSKNYSAVILKKLPEKLGIARDVFVPVGKFTFPADFVIVEYESDPCVPLFWKGPLLRIYSVSGLIDVHGEKKDSPGRISKSSSSSPTLISLKESELIWEEFEAYLASDSFPPGNSNPSSLLPPFHNSLSGSTTSSSPSLHISETSDYFLEEFADELAHITFPPGNDDLPFDAESDLLELEHLLNHDPIKDMDSILEDSVDENSLDDTIFEMFTDEHDLDYSSPPLWIRKIKSIKLLFDELDLPESNNVLPFPEYDSVFYEDFSEVEALSSTDNEEKVFNPGILIHGNLFKVTNFTTPEKNVKKTTNASLILEDFNHPLYELLSPKEVPEFILLFSWNYLIGALKLSKSPKFLKAQWRFFLALTNEELSLGCSVVSTYIPLTRLKYGDWVKLSDPKQAFCGRHLMLFRSYDCPDSEASRARGFCPSITRASNPRSFWEFDIQQSCIGLPFYL